MKNILFLCTGNSCRSQMAEGWAKKILPPGWQAWSAGIETHGLNQRAVQVMAEAGVDISGHQSQLIGELDCQQFDLVITVCDHAHESCPLFAGKGQRLHHSFADPPRLAAEETDPEKALDHYRRVRDEIRAFVAGLQLASD